MSGKKTQILVLLVVILTTLTSCNYDTQDSQRQATPEAKRTQQIQQFYTHQEKKFTPEQVALTERLKTNDKKEHFAVLKIVEGKLFSGNALSDEIYKEESFQGWLSLYSLLFHQRVVLDLKEDSHWNESLTKFDERFIAQCLDKDIQYCTNIQEQLVREGSYSEILYFIALQKTSKAEKLQYFGAAVDFQNDTEFPELYNAYLLLVVEITKNPVHKENLEDSEFKRHLRNAQNIISFTPWDKPDEFKLALFKDIRPWEIDQSNNVDLNLLRGELGPYLPIYLREDEGLRNELSQAAEELFKKVFINPDTVGVDATGQMDDEDLDFFQTTFSKVHNLKEYPSFHNIDPDSMNSINPLHQYFIYRLFLGLDTVPSLVQTHRHVLDKQSFADDFWKASQLLIRYKTAQLSLNSIDFVTHYLNESSAKSELELMAIINKSRDLSPIWNSFRNIQTQRMRLFLDHQQSFYSDKTYQDITDFFSSIERNILKTAVYPLHLAFIYHIAKGNEDVKFRQTGLEQETVDIKTIMDRFFNGKTMMVWFPFTSIQNKHLRVKDYESVTLTRQEILDSFQYFIGTRTFEKAQIDLDDLIMEVIVKTMINKEYLLSKAIDVQTNLYFDQNGFGRKFITWCNNLNSDTPEDEILDFFSLHEAITPFSDNYQKFNGPTKYKGYNNAADLYFGDSYSIKFKKHVIRNSLNLNNETQTFIQQYFVAMPLYEINDRIRAEFPVVMNLFRQLLKTVDLYSSKFDSIKEAKLSRSRNEVNRIDLLIKAYLGAQMQISSEVRDCRFKAADESSRRARHLAFSEEQYLRKFIHPLLKLVHDKKITPGEASQYIMKIHGNNPGSYDKITQNNNQPPVYHYEITSFATRLRWYLTSGMKASIKVFRPDFAGPPIELAIDTEPVVGSHLSITPEIVNSQDSAQNSFLKIARKNRRRYLQYDPEKSSEIFAKESLVRIVDQMRKGSPIDKFTSWDLTDTTSYLRWPERDIQFFTNFFQMGEFEHLDYSKPECREYTGTLDESCFIKTQFTWDDLAKEMSEWYKVLDLDTEEKLNYFELIGDDGYTALEYLDITMLYDATLLKVKHIRNNQGETEYIWQAGQVFFRELTGYFDLIHDILSTPIAGEAFNTGFDLYRGNGSSICANGVFREGCHWGNEKSRALNLYRTMTLRPKPYLFYLETDLVKENYIKIRDDVRAHFQRPLDLEKNSHSLFKKHWTRDTSLLVTTRRDEMLLEPLGITHRDTAEIHRRRFLIEQTGEFFIEKEPDWSSYFKWFE